MLFDRLALCCYSFYKFYFISPVQVLQVLKNKRLTFAERLAGFTKYPNYSNTFRLKVIIKQPISKLFANFRIGD